MTADHNVIDPYQSGQRADRENDWQRRKTGGQKRQTDDVGFARAPIAVKQRGGAFPIDVPRTMDCAALSNDQISHLAWGDCSQTVAPDKRFINPASRQLYII